MKDNKKIDKNDKDKRWRTFVTAFSLIGTALGILSCGMTFFSLFH